MFLKDFAVGGLARAIGDIFQSRESAVKLILG